MEWPRGEDDARAGALEPRRFLSSLRDRFAGLLDMDRVRVLTSHGLPSVLIDPGQFEMALLAMLGTALARTRGEVVLAAEPHSLTTVRLTVSVADDGGHGDRTARGTSLTLLLRAVA